MPKQALTKDQAVFLRTLQRKYEDAQTVFDTGLRAIALGLGSGGSVAFDLGADPWIELKPADDVGKAG